MNLQQVQTWVARLDAIGQADIPMDIGGVIITPRDLLVHAEANDAIWQKLKKVEL